LRKIFVLCLIFLLSELSGFEIKNNYLLLKSSTIEYIGSNQYPLIVSVAVLGSSFLLDKSIKKFVVNNQNKDINNFANLMNNFGDYKIVFPALAFVGTYGLVNKDDRIYQTTLNSFQSFFLAGSINLLTKFIVGRERPFGTDNQFIFRPFSFKNKFNSFFSGHTTIAWSVFTPFALAYHNPYLYLIPISVNFSRIYKNQHWLSDTLASTIVGFSSGYIIYQFKNDNNFKLYFSLNSISLSYKF